MKHKDNELGCPRGSINSPVIALSFSRNEGVEPVTHPLLCVLDTASDRPRLSKSVKSP